MNTFDDICRELSADLAAAVEAQTERTLRPRTATKKPSGIEETKRRIEAAFKAARRVGPTVLVPKSGGRSLSTREAASARPLRPLAEQAVVLIQTAERTVSSKPVRHSLHEHSHIVIAPRESFASLVEQALAAIERDMPKVTKKNERHEVE